MAMPTGDSPQKVEAYYQYLQAHQEAEHAVQTWNVDWGALLWMWGFVIVLSIVLILWIWQYRSTRQRAGGIYPIDSFGGYTTELAGPATFFFLVFSAIIVAGAVVLIAGHIIYGQKF
jgi:hypothetical protein